MLPAVTQLYKNAVNSDTASEFQKYIKLLKKLNSILQNPAVRELQHSKRNFENNIN